MNKRIPIIIGFLILILAVWVQLTPMPLIQSVRQRLEHLAYDIQLRTLLLTHKKTNVFSVSIVDIDDKSLREVGRWPWPRSKLALLLQRLQENGAVVVAFDMLFAEKEENVVDQISNQLEKLNSTDIAPTLQKLKPHFDYDLHFGEQLKKIDSVLGITFTPNKEQVGLLPPPVFTLQPKQKDLGFIIAPGYVSDISELITAGKYGGFINVFPDPDGIIRRVPLLIRFNDKLYPSLALEAVRVFLLANVNLITAEYGNALQLEGVSLGDHTIPTDNASSVIIPFVGKSYTIPFYSAADVLNNKIPADSMQGKIIFVGSSAIGLGDVHPTAVEAVYPGVEIHATIAQGILNDTFSFKPPWSLGAEVVITILIGLLCIFLFPYLGPRTLGLLIFVIPTALLFVNNEIWERTGLIISFLIPMMLPIILALINILYGYLFETLRREHLKTMFGQYVPETHIDEMLKSSGKNYALHGEDRDMTVLFADIRNFTTISEPMSASELKDLLNEFFTPMTEIIFKYRGTIDKYVGDMIMAFWGAPLKDNRHARNALTAALEMQIAVNQLRIEFAKRNLPEIHIGIGLNSGVMSVGDMGSKFRRNYTVLGDAVNLGSRVEGLTKFYGVNIMATEETIKNQDKFIFRRLDRVRVKGKKNGIVIYEVICRKKSETLALHKEIDMSERALDFYFNQDWEKSEELFLSLQEQHPEVKLYTLYLARIQEFKKNSPGKEWDGIYIHATK